MGEGGGLHSFITEVFPSALHILSLLDWSRTKSVEFLPFYVPPPLPCSNSLSRYSLVTRTWNVPRYPQRNTSVGKIHIIVGREQPRIQLTSRHQESIQDSHSRVQEVWSPLVGLYRQTNTNTRWNFKFGIDCYLTAILNVYNNVDCVMCTTIVMICLMWWPPVSLNGFLYLVYLFDLE